MPPPSLLVAATVHFSFSWTKNERPLQIVLKWDSGRGKEGRVFVGSGIYLYWPIWRISSEWYRIRRGGTLMHSCQWTLVLLPNALFRHSTPSPAAGVLAVNGVPYLATALGPRKHFKAFPILLWAAHEEWVAGSGIQRPDPLPAVQDGSAEPAQLSGSNGIVWCLCLSQTALQPCLLPASMCLSSSEAYLQKTHCKVLSLPSTLNQRPFPRNLP